MHDDPLMDLGQTLSGSDFSPAGMRGDLRKTPVTEAPRTGASAPVLKAVDLASLVPEQAAHAHVAERFEVVSLLGAGSTGEVYRVRDRNLNRLIAIKVLADLVPPQAGLRDDFIAEARLTAALKHPNVLPVHDLDLSADGRLYFSMGQVDGRSLGEIITASQLHQRDARLASFNAIVTTFIAIGHAIAFAHHQGIIHQDIKPDNILLGDFGEVLMLDWGEAARPDADGTVTAKLAGTPLYMSPEQARREGSGPSSDIYCLGGTLFHALVLRPPSQADDLDEFWRKKREGIIDLPTSAERAAVPAPLLAIALRALASAPTDRYPDIDSLVQDLESYQAGLAVRAHRYSVRETAMRWFRLHRRTLAWSSALLAAVIGLSLMLFGERLKEIATWGSPVLNETFSDESWRSRWAIHNGSFERRGQSLVSTSAAAAVVMCRTRFVGSTAIEFTGEVLPGSPLCDLSIYWCRDMAYDDSATQVVSLTDLYKLQVGAYDNSCSAILLPDNRQLSYSPFRVEHGRRYRVRAEIVDNLLRLIVDGHVLCEYSDPFPFSSGYVGLYGFYRGKAFSDVQIFSLGLPQKLQATAIGDAFAQKQLFDLAAEQYGRAAASFPQSAIGDEALYKAGLCQCRAGHFDQAFATWQPLAHSSYDARIELHQIDHLFAIGRHDDVLKRLAAATLHASADSRQQIALRWAGYVYDLRALPTIAVRTDLLTRYLALHDQYLADQAVADRASLECLISLNRYQEILDRYPTNRFFAAVALTYQRRCLDLIKGYPDQRAMWNQACLDTANYDEIAAHADDGDEQAIVAILRGHAAQIVTSPDVDPNIHAMALVSLGLYQQVLALPHIEKSWRDLALIGLGKPEDVSDPDMRDMVLDHPRQMMERLPLDHRLRAWPRYLLALETFIAGERTSAMATMALPGGDLDRRCVELFFARDFMLPFLAEMQGDAGAISRRCTAILANERFEDSQRPWYAARLLTGQISPSEFLAQPLQITAKAWYCVISGIKADRAGTSAIAMTAYRDYLALGPTRHGLTIAPIMDAFVLWRLHELGGGPRDRQTLSPSSDLHRP
jgi:serine/threonine protein kinase/tetratricopeptide (TPR) repeat protein